MTLNTFRKHLDKLEARIRKGYPKCDPSRLPVVLTLVGAGESASVDRVYLATHADGKPKSIVLLGITDSKPEAVPSSKGRSAKPVEIIGRPDNAQTRAEDAESDLGLARELSESET